MAIVLRVFTDERDLGTPARYVVDCDVDARAGRGVITLGDLAHARRFADAREALTYWKRQSTVQPLRDDGKPNRPLTACTVELVTVAEG